MTKPTIAPNRGESTYRLEIPADRLVDDATASSGYRFDLTRDDQLSIVLSIVSQLWASNVVRDAEQARRGR